MWNKIIDIGDSLKHKASTLLSTRITHTVTVPRRIGPQDRNKSRTDNIFWQQQLLNRLAPVGEQRIKYDEMIRLDKEGGLSPGKVGQTPRKCAKVNRLKASIQIKSNNVLNWCLPA